MRKYDYELKLETDAILRCREYVTPSYYQTNQKSDYTKF